LTRLRRNRIRARKARWDYDDRRRRPRHGGGNAQGARDLAGVFPPRSRAASHDHGFAVKIKIVDGDATEFFWVSVVGHTDNQFTGRLNNSAQLVKNVKEGQIVRFAEGDIVDYLYRENGKMQGNYTACVLAKRIPREEAEAIIRQLGLSCGL